jgi:outer membrane protein assembly factor BamB
MGRSLPCVPDLHGNLTGKPEAIHWIRPDNTPDVPSPLILDDLVYLCRESGVLIVSRA